MFATKLLLSAFIAFSARTAKIQPNPNDYEWSAGAATKYGIVKVKYENESGQDYKGIYLKTNQIKRIAAVLDINESTAINKQYIYVSILSLYDIAKLVDIDDKQLEKILYIRVSNEWSYWKDYHNLFGMVFDISNIFQGGNTITTLEYDTNFEDRHVSRINISFKLEQRKADHLRYKPYYKQVYRNNRYDNVNDYQFKPEVGIEYTR